MLGLSPHVSTNHSWALFFSKHGRRVDAILVDFLRFKHNIRIFKKFLLFKMDKTRRNKQGETKKKPKLKSKWAKREARLKKVRDEEIEMTELDEKILDVSTE